MLIPLLYFLVVCFGIGISRFLISKNNWIKKITTFSGAYLLGSAFLVILPEHVFLGNNSNLGLWVLAGVLTQLFLEALTKGVEHGHHHKENSKFDFDYLLLFFGLILHEFLEGMPSQEGSEQYNMSILVHKLPVAIIFGSLTLKSEMNNYYKAFFVLIFALASPMGFFLGKDFGIGNLNQLMAFVSGILLHISTTIIFESNQKHSFKLDRFLIILLGFFLAFLSSIIF